MKLVLCLLTVLTFSTITAATDSTVLLSSVEGESFEVSYEELVRGYNSVFHSIPEELFKKIETNEDGTVIIFNPVFRIGSRYVKISQRYSNYFGVCRFLGYTNSHGVETRYWKPSKVEIFASINSNGSLDEMRECSSNDSYSYIKSIVCSK